LFGPSSEIRLSSKSASLTGDRWEYDEAVVQVSGSTASSRIIIEGTAAVTLESASVILDADGACPIDIENGAAAEIILSGTSRLSAGPGAAAIHVPGGSMLTISGAGESGALNVTGGLYSAGIGGGSGEAGGVIQIDSGEVAASGGYLAAAGGGGFGGDGGTIVISGGTVSAVGGFYGAGIGDGVDHAGGIINIMGAK
jgi:hypothetical protein